MNYDFINYYGSMNMTWTSKAPDSAALKRLGISDRNFPKQIGSTVVTGAGGVVGGQAAGMAIDVMSSVATLAFEGGSEESIRDRVVISRKNYWNSNKMPLKPAINAFLNMIFIKIILGSFVNLENNHLMNWSNFGPNGNLPAGD